jgi:hypothetical protein
MDCVGLGCFSGNCFGSDAGCATSGVVVVAIRIAADAAECQIFFNGSPRRFQGVDFATTAADLEPKLRIAIAVLYQPPGVT